MTSVIKKNIDIYDNSDSIYDIEELSDTESESENELPPENYHFDPLKFFTNKEFMYYKMVETFFKNCSYKDKQKMVEIINSKSGISLRVLDWFVTRYSKKKIDFDCNNTSEIFDVHISYKAQLKSYKKRYFDPFRRKKKFYFNYDNQDKSKILHTTLGQLNFFKWAISNNILGYVEKNIQHVTKAMNQSNKEDKKKKEKKKKEKIKLKKMEELEFKNNKKENNITVKNKQKNNNVNIKATKTVEEDEVQIIVSFN